MRWFKQYFIIMNQTYIIQYNTINGIQKQVLSTCINPSPPTQH